ncbi:MAG: hypothetical protein K9K67_04230 [Bacteriovoracaceae bacterium]|nr:hypothetical protein [Bacteriovoracaceae bacterium]
MGTKRGLFFTLTIFAFVLITPTPAYVENVTNGYPNCMACHINPTGGGILTDYGRSLSSELMATIKTKNFQDPFFGLVKNNNRIKWGGHIRTIQTRFENNQIKRGSSFIMQKNVEAAAYVRDFVFVGTVGTKEGPSERNPEKGDFISERHFALYQADNTVRIKIGKFRQNYGLNDPNHTRFTKRDLGFGSYSETYQLEVFKILENGEALLSTSLGRLDLPRDRQEKNVMGQWTHYLDGKSRLTTNILLGESATNRRSIVGINGVLPIINKSNVFRFQLDYQVSEQITTGPRTAKTKGIYGNFLVGRKLIDGLFPYFIYEHKQTNIEQSRLSMTTSPGIGLQFFPIAHFELQIEHQYRTNLTQSDNPEHRTFAALHVYL